MSSETYNQDIEKTAGAEDLQRERQRSDGSVSSFRYDSKNVYINDNPIDKESFRSALGLTTSETLTPTRELTNAEKYGNPIPAGLAAFSATTMSLGLVQMHAKTVTHANVLLVALLTTSGLVEFITGVLCFVVGNTWASCTFLMFGGFWSSYSFLLMDLGGISSAYPDTYEYNMCIGILFLPWCVFSFALWLTTLKSSWALTILMFDVFFFVLLFTIAQFISSVVLYKAGGFFCVLSGVLGFYNMFNGMADNTNSFFTLPDAPLQKNA